MIDSRRKFIRTSSLGLLGLPSIAESAIDWMKYKDLVIGHNTHQYKIDLNWGALNPKIYPVNDCHEMVQDSKGRIILLTNHTKNNIIIYDKSGNVQESWGTEFPGAHGLTLHNENGEDFLYISDNTRHQVIKTTLDGRILMVLDYPVASGNYEKKEQYVPTETAVADNGDIYVADGYGQQYIMQYSSKGDLLNVFGGRGKGEDSFDNAHGICIDRRASGGPILLITDRNRNKLKRFALDGTYLSTIDLPGAYICRPVIHGEHVYLATIWSYDGSQNSGFISILNRENQMISAPGGKEPVYKNGSLERMYQTLKLFRHPHDVCVDEDENLYVCQWNAGKSYPIKLQRV